MEMITCPRCGASNPAGKRYCRICGASLTGDAVVETSAAASDSQPDVLSEGEVEEATQASGIISAPPEELLPSKKRSRRGYLVGITAVLVIVLLIGAAVAYYSVGMSTYNKAVAAHNSRDAATALVYYNTVTRYYPAFLGFPRKAAEHHQECALYFAASQAKEKGDYQTASECYNRLWVEYPTSPFNPLIMEERPEVLYTYAGELAQAGDYEEAITYYQLVVEEHPASEWAAQAPGAIGQAYYDWGAQLREGGEYEQAIKTYQTLLDKYPDSLAAKEAKAAMAGTYGDWATQLREQGEYAAAIEKYQAVLEYASTTTRTRTEALLAETYGEWAGKLRGDGDYQSAIEKYETVLKAYPGAPTARQARRAAAETYAEWAAQLQKAGKLEDAVEKYQILVSEYADTPAATQARPTIAETYVEWAGQLQEAGDYGRAATNYQIVLDQYSDTPAAARALEGAAATYAAWAAQLAEAGKYEEAVEKYQVVLSEYPDASAAAEAKEAAAETYYEWGSELHKGGRYSEGIEKYKAAASEFPGTKSASIAQVAIGRAYNDWGTTLRSQRKYIEAMGKFTLAKQSTSDPDVVAAADKGYSDALWDLSQDTSGEGKQVMDEALAGACDGKPAASPAVGLSKDEPGKALFGGWEFTLPNDLKAVKPAHFRYVVCLTKGTSVVERCGPYCCPTGYVVRQQYWWNIKVRDTRMAQVVAEKTFYGPAPRACQQTESFPIGASEKYLSGDAPSANEVVNWLKGIIH